MNAIMNLLGIILKVLYDLVGNYGLAIVLFTIFIKILILPLGIKQQVSMAKTQKLAPLLKEIQDKYKNDKEKLSKETMGLYKKHGANPMSGCLPLIIQLPIIMALYWVVRKPITYMMGVSYDDVWRLAQALHIWAEQEIANGGAITQIIKDIQQFNPLFIPDALEAMGKTFASHDKMVEALWKSFGNYEIAFAELMFRYPAILTYDVITSAGGHLANLSTIDFNFLGLDLSKTPSFANIDWLWSIPILSGATTYMTTKMTPRSPAQSEQENSMQSFMAIMPLFTAGITFTLPAGVGLYWVVSNLFQMGQQFMFNKFLTPRINLDIIEGEVIRNGKSGKNSKKLK